MTNYGQCGQNILNLPNTIQRGGEQCLNEKKDGGNGFNDNRKQECPL